MTSFVGTGAQGSGLFEFWPGCCSRPRTPLAFVVAGATEVNRTD